MTRELLAAFACQTVILSRTTVVRLFHAGCDQALCLKVVKKGIQRALPHRKDAAALIVQKLDQFVAVLLAACEQHQDCRRPGSPHQFFFDPHGFTSIFCCQHILCDTYYATPARYMPWALSELRSQKGQGTEHFPIQRHTFLECRPASVEIWC